jgi:hypothetical protein
MMGLTAESDVYSVLYDGGIFVLIATFDLGVSMANATTQQPVDVQVVCSRAV